ncbi:serine hydrolase [Muricauda sp. TY007]|uniref:serine hydrolase domain-containing protein n=1 Tax=Allomuricauda sp. TY007 TaxID=2683200 RepID=UPI0013C03DA4|nr:serine hydrolase domain-containing protein [Muricauda sp. TY007]NDV15581.1 serine hydrolase [Muricauda sp. TY007]
MRNYLIVLMVFLSMSCLEDRKRAVQLSSKMEAVKDSVDTYFSKLTELKKFNGVVLVYKNDTLLLNKAYNLNNKGTTYITTRSQFDIHSVSKLMTYYLLAKLEHEGELSIDQTLNNYFEDFPKGKEITLEMLLKHTSGLPRELVGFEGEEYDLTSSEIIELAKKQSLLFAPGTNVQYSNVGYELLYGIVSRAYDKPFAQCVVDEIFEPLQMDSSGAHFFVKENRVKNMAQNHVLKDNELVQIDNIQHDEFRTARLFSTANDLKKFIDHVKQEPYASFLKDGNGVIAKDGGSKGIRAQVYTDLQNNFDFVLLANYDGIPFFDTIDDMVKLMMSQPVKYPKEINRNSIVVKKEVLQQYEGSYTFADFDGLVLEVRLVDGQLAIFQEGDKVGGLQAETPTVFFEDPKAAESFEFIKNESGSFDALMGWKGIVVEGKRN